MEAGGEVIRQAAVCLHADDPQSVLPSRVELAVDAVGMSQLSVRLRAGDSVWGQSCGSSSGVLRGATACPHPRLLLLLLLLLLVSVPRLRGDRRRPVPRRH